MANRRTEQAAGIAAATPKPAATPQPGTTPDTAFRTETASDSRHSRADPRRTKKPIRSTPAISSVDDLKHQALLAIRYHNSRARYLDGWRRFLDFIVIMGGAGATTSFIGQASTLGAWLGLMLAAVGGLQLVFGFGEKAQEHTWLRRRYCDVLARVTEAETRGSTTPEALARFAKKFASIWADEPPMLHVLECVAYNAAKRTLERDCEDDLIRIPTLRFWLRHVFSGEGFDPKTAREVSERNEKSA